MVLCVCSLYIPLQFQFCVRKLGLEVDVCFEFYLLAFLMGFFPVVLMGLHREYHGEFFQVPTTSFHLVVLLPVIFTCSGFVLLLLQHCTDVALSHLE